MGGHLCLSHHFPMVLGARVPHPCGHGALASSGLKVPQFYSSCVTQETLLDDSQHLTHPNALKTTWDALKLICWMNFLRTLLELCMAIGSRLVGARNQLIGCSFLYADNKMIKLYYALSVMYS